MYTIKQVAQTVGISANALRYYEKEGLLPAIQRDVNGVRQYTDHDVDRAKMIHILRMMNMPIADVRQAIYATGDEPTADEIQRFEEQLDQLLVDLDRQIDELEQAKQIVRNKKRLIAIEKNE